jgi:hypothetical protein
LTKIDKDALTNVVSDLTKENKSLVKNLSHEYEKKTGKTISYYKLKKAIDQNSNLKRSTSLNDCKSRKRKCNPILKHQEMKTQPTKLKNSIQAN